MGQLADFNINEIAGSIALIMGSLGGLFLIIFKSRCSSAHSSTHRSTHSSNHRFGETLMVVVYYCLLLNKIYDYIFLNIMFISKRKDFILIQWTFRN